MVPSRRVRVYHLRFDGHWVDWGIGWLWMGGEIPVSDPFGSAGNNAKIQHLLVKEQQKDTSAATHAVTPASSAAAAEPSSSASGSSGGDASSSSHAPLTSLGLPSLRTRTLLSLHIPDASHFQCQNDTIITFTTRAEAQHRAAHSHSQAARVLHAQHEQLRGQPVAADADAAVAEAGGNGGFVSEGNEIDIALSFQSAQDAGVVWRYIHSFPSVLAQAEEEERQAAEEAEQRDREEAAEEEEAAAAAAAAATEGSQSQEGAGGADARHGSNAAADESMGAVTEDSEYTFGESGVG
jgi:hypothetical protein